MVEADERESASAAPSFRESLAAFSDYLRPHRLAIASGCGLLFLAGAIGLAQPLAAKLVIDRLADGSGVGTASATLGATVIFGAIALAVGNFVVLRVAEAVVLTGRRRLIHHILRLPITGMRRIEPGDLMSRVTADTTLLRQVASQALVQVLVGLVMLVGAMILMAFVDVILFVTAVAVVALLAVAVAATMPVIRRAAHAAQKSVGEMGGALERVLGAFTTVKASGAEAVEMGRLGQSAEGAYRQGVMLARWGSIAGTLSGLAIQIAFLVVLGVGGARVVNGAISVSTLVAFLLYILYLTHPIMLLVNAGTLFQAGRAAVQRIAEVTRLPLEAVDGGQPVPPRDRGTPQRPVKPATVSFDDVWFTYPGRQTHALAGFTLEVPATGVTAIVGPSGAGKTTILCLLERFYEPDQGRVLLDGTDLREWDLVRLRAAIGYVEQDAPVMAGTLRENLLYAAPDASERELHSVLQVTRLEQLLERLGGGLDSKLHHRGSSLSGGERQRIAIARALLRRPRLLLLDEATSQLDAENEAALRKVVADIATTTTVILVAHRLSTARVAERIVVMQDARLRTVGAHNELIRTDDLYARLVAGMAPAPSPYQST
jgi:ABC-type multidrug transport system fused ATPase/permease subunit